MTHTVKDVAKIAGISRRTLHYYDEIGLLPPASVGENGYRYYEEAEMLRLQQILFFRELGLSLEKIQQILANPNFDTLTALQNHRQALQKKANRLNHLLHTIDHTIAHLKGELTMKQKDMFAGFEEKQKEYEEIATQRYGADEVQASVRRWQSYSKAEQAQIKVDGQQIYVDIRDNMAAGHDSAVVQSLIGRWHQHMRHFYEPDVARLRGLGQLYVDDPAFRAVYEALDPNLPEFLRDAINHYCDNLS